MLKRTLKLNSLIISFFILALLLPSTSFADDQNNMPSNTVSHSKNSQKNNIISNTNIYVNNGKVGFGLSWSPANSALYSGFADIRYWFNRWFGIDGGIGFISSSYGGTDNLLGAGNLNTFHLTTFQIQGMVPIIERQHFVFYGDFDVVPEIGSPSFGYELLPGIGIEYAFPEYSSMSVYFQLNPIPSWGYTNGNYVAYTPIFAGFHFYF